MASSIIRRWTSSAKKIGPPVRLESLDRERHLLQHLVEKRQRCVGRSAWCQTGHKEAAAVVDGRKLIEAWPDLACVHLHSIAGNRTVVTFRLPTAPLAGWQDVEPVPREHLVDRGCRKADLVQT